jgi:hypothetical protein
VKRKKKKRKKVEKPLEAMETVKTVKTVKTMETMRPPSRPGPIRPRDGRKGGFYWGLTLGFAATLGLILASDAGWSILPAPASSAGTGGPAPGTPAQAAAAGTPLYLAGAIPAEGRVYVDGRPVDATEEATAVRVSIPAHAQRIEIRGPQGTLWTTRLDAGSAAPDTLNPLLGGDLVIELEQQARGGAVYLDGAKRGTAPGSLRDVPPGWHVVSIRDGDTVLFEDGCTVRSGEVAVVTVPPVPARGKARLNVRSRILEDTGFRETTGNLVVIDGNMVGETPLSATLDAGFHGIRIEAEGQPARIEVLHLDAGGTRYVNAEFGREDRLSVIATPPVEVNAQRPLAIPVRIAAHDKPVLLQEGAVHLVRPGQSQPVVVPLVPSGTDPALWVAVIPLDVVSPLDDLVGYVRCRDDMGRSGDSELFHVRLQ